jgi:ribose 5-phosphate isomerase B
MNIWIASDHGGFDLKEKIYNDLNTRQKYDVHDLGCYKPERCDYPSFAKEVSQKVNQNGGFGLLICTTGQGMCMTANAQPGIRAALVHNQNTAKMSREHNNANVMCIGAKYTTVDEAMYWIDTFLETKFSDEERHHHRVDQIKN